MTRINTNVAALRGLQSVNKANSTLGTTLQRLSTGLQINNGKDNPSGLIASETLRSQVTAIEQSIKNSNRANNVISTADSALGEINGLLNQVRGLVQEGLNTGALSDSEIGANQLQIDAALNAINRIAGNTSFAGDKLIDGSKAFTKTITTADQAKLSDVQLNEALFGSSATITVDATITTAAAKGTLYYTGGALTQATTVEVSGSKGSQVLFFGASSSEADITNAINNTSDVTGVTAASAAGTNATVSLAGPSTATSDDLAITAASAGTTGNSTTVTLTAGTSATSSAAVSGSAITVTLAVNTGAYAGLTSSGPTTQTYDDLTFTAAAVGTSGNSVAVVFQAATNATTAASVSGNTITVALAVNTSSTITATASEAAAAISANTSAAALVTVAAGGSGTGVFATAASASLSGGASSGAITATASQVASAIAANTSAAALVTVATTAGTGVVGSAAATSLTGGADSRITLTSSNFGSDEFVDINVLAGGFSTSQTVGGSTSYRDAGSDISAIINGQVAVGKGLQASIATASLNAALTFVEGSNIAATNARVTITGGGSVFQIGQDVSANGQIGIGIDAVNTARLGGVSGKLYELGSGAGKSLLDVGPSVQGADLVKIIEESIDRVSTLRGRLGALQKNVIETNISSLGVALENISEARSQIVDTDFAAETANLQKAQILSQSSLTVLGIANQQPGQVLSLLRG